MHRRAGQSSAWPSLLAVISLVGAFVLSGCEQSRTYTVVNDTEMDLVVQHYSAGSGTWLDYQEVSAGSAASFMANFGEDGCTTELNVRAVDESGAEVKTFTKACANSKLHVP